MTDITLLLHKAMVQIGNRALGEDVDGPFDIELWPDDIELFRSIREQLAGLGNTRVVSAEWLFELITERDRLRDNIVELLAERDKLREELDDLDMELRVRGEYE